MNILNRLLDTVKEVGSAFFDKRSGTGKAIYTMKDICLAAFSMFFIQSESFLGYQRVLEKGHGTSNCQSLFGMENIPTDNHIRSMLDEVAPSQLQPCFTAALETLKNEGGLPALQRLDGRVLIALDGTEYFCSQKLGCPHCQERKRSNGKTEHYHSMLCATLVAPGHNMALPLMPEFITPQDGHEKQDCEREAAKRWLTTHHEEVRSLRPVYLGDSLFSCHSICQSIKEKEADFLFNCKPGSHKAVYDFLDGAEKERHQRQEPKKGHRPLVHTYEWVNDVPIRDSKDAVHVNWLSVRVVKANGEVVYKSDFITSLPISKDNVVELVSCGRARWKIENESFNVLKNNGYHIEHNFGHGKKNLAMMFATMNLLAFAFHTVMDCCSAAWKEARKVQGTRKRFFDHIKCLSEYFVFPSWESLFKILINPKTPPPMVVKNPSAA